MPLEESTYEPIDFTGWMDIGSAIKRLNEVGDDLAVRNLRKLQERFAYRIIVDVMPRNIGAFVMSGQGTTMHINAGNIHEDQTHEVVHEGTHLREHNVWGSMGIVPGLSWLDPESRKLLLGNARLWAVTDREITEWLVEKTATTLDEYDPKCAYNGEGNEVDDASKLHRFVLKETGISIAGCHLRMTPWSRASFEKGILWASNNVNLMTAAKELRKGQPVTNNQKKVIKKLWERLAARGKKIPIKNSAKFIKGIQNPEADIDENLMALVA